MNTESPLIPQGSLLDQKNKGRARVRIAVFIVLAIHGIGLLALLMQGCKKEPEAAVPPPEETATNTAPAFAEPTNAIPEASTNLTSVPSNPPPVVTEPGVPVPLPTATASEYKVVQGDTFSGVAKKFHVSTKAITDANPGVDSTKLQVGQTLHIPAPVPPSVAGTTTSGPVNGTAGATVHAVKSGETLTSIATRYGVTVRALRTANHLTTDRIVVGQKLTIPIKTPPTSGTTPTNGGTPPVGQ